MCADGAMGRLIVPYSPAHRISKGNLIGRLNTRTNERKSRPITHSKTSTWPFGRSDRPITSIPVSSASLSAFHLHFGRERTLCGLVLNLYGTRPPAPCVCPWCPCVGALNAVLSLSHAHTQSGAVHRN